MIAFSSLVYSVVAVPALTRLTLTFGYCFSNAATMSLDCGAQAQNVSVVGCCSACAIVVAPPDVAPPPPLLVLLPPLLQAAAPAARASPAAPIAAVRQILGPRLVEGLFISALSQLVVGHCLTLPAARPDRQ